jgi:lipopolysaccharide transport system permease protein
MNKLLTKFKEINKDYELLVILAKRDISVRYKQTILGIAWAIINLL